MTLQGLRGARSGETSAPEGSAVGGLPLVGVAVAATTMALASGLVFAKLTDSLLEGENLPTVDERVTAWLVDHRDGTLTALLRFTSHLADPLVTAAVVGVSVVVFWSRGRRRAAAFLVVSCLGAGLLVQVVKVLIGRDRPDNVNRLVEVTGAAFPSGHAAQSVACYGAIAIVVLWSSRSRTTGRLAVVVAGSIVLLVGVSRVYLGVHWTSDVIAGWSLGVTWLAYTVAVFSVAGWAERRSGTARTHTAEAT